MNTFLRSKDTNLPNLSFLQKYQLLAQKQKIG